MKADLEICRLLNDALVKAEDEIVKTTVFEIQVNAALAGHDLGPFEPVESIESGGYQARCRRCNQTAWVGESGLMYSLLGKSCTDGEGQSGCCTATDQSPVGFIAASAVKSIKTRR